MIGDREPSSARGDAARIDDSDGKASPSHAIKEFDLFAQSRVSLPLMQSTVVRFAVDPAAISLILGPARSGLRQSNSRRRTLPGFFLLSNSSRARGNSGRDPYAWLTGRSGQTSSSARAGV